MLKPTFNYEQKLWRQGYRYIAGLDEVGRGCLAGPVVAAAVVFPPGLSLGRHSTLCTLRDSKLLSPIQREKLSPIIKETALTWAIGRANVAFINRNGIVAATEAAMLKALDRLSVRPNLHLIDYFRIKAIASQKQEGVVDGDSLVASIAAASVIAKVYRDGLMTNHHRSYPQYYFASNKGYGTQTHVNALRRFGPSPLHRRLPNNRDLWGSY